MKKIWAPWRIEYILQPKIKGCIFCDKPKQNQDRENLILYKGKHSFIIMNYYPYNNGHIMIVPYRHLADLNLLTNDEQAELMSLVAKSTKILAQTLQTEGMNIGMNLGRVAGAGIDDHLHFHIVPRWNGDTNFMPVTGNSKVISQGLFESWDTLKPFFDNILID